MKLFVTGGTGFIGSHFINAALNAGHQVTALNFSGSVPAFPIIESSSLEWIESSMEQLTLDQIQGHEALIHLASAGVNPELATWDLCFEVNVNQSLRFGLKAQKAGIKKFIICGSCFEYGKSANNYDFIPSTATLLPTSAYHASKAAASMAAIGMCYEFKLELAIVRPFHVYGEGEREQRLWPSLKKAALAGEDFRMTSGEQIRDFVPVEYVVNSINKIIEGKIQKGKPVLKNIGSGTPQSTKQFAEFWWKKWRAKGKLLLGEIPYRKNEVMRYVPEN